MLQKTLFYLRSSNTHQNIPFNFKFFYELKAKGSSILHQFVWGFHFSFHLSFTKVHFYFKGVSKNCESVQKGSFSSDSFHARLNSHYKVWRYRKKIKAKTD